MHEASVRFKSREDAGRRLAATLRHYDHHQRAIVLGLPRGGVVTAAVVAEQLGLPLDILVVRKLEVPGHERVSMGAVGPEGLRVLNRQVVERLSVGEDDVESVTLREMGEVDYLERLFRAGAPPLSLRGRVAILVDDGLATGATMDAAVHVVRRLQAMRVVVAVPLGPLTACVHLGKLADELVCLETPEPFHAVGWWYNDFGPTDDLEVIALLDKARSSRPDTEAPLDQPPPAPSVTRGEISS